MTCRISVLIGVYNCEKTLKSALDSLLEQTYKEFKVIMCDDGSTDDTYAIAKEYTLKHSNFILISNGRNMGLNHTLNHCLEYVDTEYCARMDGDDLCDPYRFEKQIKFLDAHPEYAIVSTPMKYFDDNGVFHIGKAKEGEPSKNVFNYGSPFCHAPCMVRTIAYKDVGGYSEDKRLLRVEDYNLWMKMYAKGYRGYNLNECLYLMRDDQNAAKRRTFQARINGIYAHWMAYKTLNLSFFLFLKYAFGNLIKGMMPTFLYIFIYKARKN